MKKEDPSDEEEPLGSATRREAKALTINIPGESC